MSILTCKVYQTRIIGHGDKKVPITLPILMKLEIQTGLKVADLELESLANKQFVDEYKRRYQE